MNDSTFIDTLIINKNEKKKTSSKPRMSKIVEKAVILKQLSDLNLGQISLEKVEKIKKVKSEPKCETPRVEPETPRVEPETPIASRIQPTFICKECNITFTSEILFNRHPNTIKHRVALQKQRK